MDRIAVLARVAMTCCVLVVAGNAPAAEAPAEANRAELDEVAVVGKSLRRLRREAVAAEERFYKRFNELNTQDEFDIHCEKEKLTGTLVPQRQCRIRFLAEEGAIDAQAFYRGLTGAAAARGVHTPLATLWPAWQQRREEYQRTVRDLVEQDAGLRALAAEWGQLLLQVEARNARESR